VLTSRITNVTWNFGDDGEAYFPFAKKMLTTGSLIAEPFSERRTLSGLGAATYLDTNVITFLPFSYIKLSDIGIGFSLLLILIWRYHKKGYVRGSVFISFPALLLPFPIVNISSLFLSVTLFVYLLFNLNRPIQNSSLNFIRFLSPLATLIVLKNSNLITCVLLLLLFSPMTSSMKITNIKSFFQGLQSRFTNSLIVFLLSLPWYLSSIKNSGDSFNFQNPRNLVFARGLYSDKLNESWISATGFNFLEILLRSSLFGPILMALILLFKFRKRLAKGQISLLTRITLISFVSALFTYFNTDGYGIDRYTFATNFAVFVVVLFTFSQFAGNILYSCLVLFFLTLTIFGSISRFDLIYTLATLKQSFELSSIPTDPCSGKNILREIQNSTEVGARILVTTSYACQLDYSRNEIVINDFPGMVSPSPGMDFENGLLSLMNYLRLIDLDYILVEFPNEESLFYLQILANREIDSDWLVTQATRKLEFYDLILTSDSKIEFVDALSKFALIRLSGPKLN
jgi:hypothetical protein